MKWFWNIKEVILFCFWNDWCVNNFVVTQVRLRQLKILLYNNFGFLKVLTVGFCYRFSEKDAILYLCLCLCAMKTHSHFHEKREKDLVLHLSVRSTMCYRWVQCDCISIDTYKVVRHTKQYIQNKCNVNVKWEKGIFPRAVWWGMHRHQQVFSSGIGRSFGSSDDA